MGTSSRAWFCKSAARSSGARVENQALGHCLKTPDAGETRARAVLAARREAPDPWAGIPNAAKDYEEAHPGDTFRPVGTTSVWYSFCAPLVKRLTPVIRNCLNPSAREGRARIPQAGPLSRAPPLCA